MKKRNVLIISTLLILMIVQSLFMFSWINSPINKIGKDDLKNFETKIGFENYVSSGAKKEFIDSLEKKGIKNIVILGPDKPVQFGELISVKVILEPDRKYLLDFLIFKEVEIHVVAKRFKAE